MLAGQRVALDEREVRGLGKLPPEQRGQVAVDLDGRNVAGPFEQFLRERAGAGADLDRQVVRPEQARVGDEADEVAVDHEVLAEPVPRVGVGLGQEGLDLVLRLRHERPVYPAADGAAAMASAQALTSARTSVFSV